MRRWLIAILIIDLAFAAWLATGRSAREGADFVFVTGTGHRFLDPQRISWMHDIRVAECFFEPLARIKLPEIQVTPAAAQRWEISDDGRIYTFHLRPHGRWSNGDPVTAGDFIYAWRRALLPDLAADYTQLLWSIRGAETFFKSRQAQLMAYAKDDANKNLTTARSQLEEAYREFDRIVGLRAPDDYTLVVELIQPVPYFLQLCAFTTFMPVHRTTVDAQTSLHVDSGRLVQDPLWTRPHLIVCNGPYVPTRRRFRRDLLMAANDNYWNRSAMANASILELIISNHANALMLYEAGHVDWLPDIPSSGSLAADLAAQQRLDVHRKDAAGTYFYNFNCQPTLAGGAANILSDGRVRRALALTINRQALVENITRLGQSPSRTFVPLGALPGYTPPVEAGADFDPARARQLLSEAGYGPERRVEGLSILYNTGAGHERIAQAIKRMWQQHLGVSVALEGMDGTVFGDRLRNHDFTIARAGWFGDYLDPTTFLDKFRTENGNNDAAYSNPKFDALMKKADAELNGAKRSNLLREAEAVMLTDQPIAPIYQYVNFHVYDPKRVQHLNLNPWNFRRLDQVRVTRNAEAEIPG